MELNVEQYIKEQLEQLDIRDIVEVGVQRLIREQALSEIKGLVQAEAKRMVVEAIEKILGGPIEVKDGWNDPVYYQTFEAMFKKELKESMSTGWKAQSVIERATRERVNKLMQEQYGSVVNQIVDALTKE